MSHSDRPDPDNVVLLNGELAATPQIVMGVLDSLHIDYKTYMHEPLYTVDQAKTVQYDKEGAHTKNLFLRNKKGNMFLLVVEQDHKVDLRGLRDRLQTPGGQFAFASTDRLGQYLGVVPGSVSPLAVINDHSCAVRVLFEKSILDQQWIFLHPCRNTHSTRMRTEDLLRVLEHWDHPVTQIDFKQADE